MTHAPCYLLPLLALTACGPAAPAPASLPTAPPAAAAPAATPAPASAAMAQAPPDEGDPFAAGVDSMAVDEADGSASVRAKLKLASLDPQQLVLRLVAADHAKFPVCGFTARVLRPARDRRAHLKLLGQGKTYRFAPQLKLVQGAPDLTDAATRSLLGACYHPPGTTLVVRVTGVDLKRRVFQAAAISHR